MNRVRARLRRQAQGDEGLGLILIIGVSIFIFALASVAVSYALNGVEQSRQRTAYEKSLATAEAGVDWAFGKLQASFTMYAADYPIPATTTTLDAAPACSAAPIGFPTSGPGAGGVFPDEASERSWATTQLQSLVAVPGCVRQGDDGEYVILKPPSGTNLKYGRVYALAAMPSFADPDRTRLVKSEYIFMPYRPQYAILTHGDLEISSSTTVTTADPADASLAAVHTNGVISGNGNPTVTGPVSSTGPLNGFTSNNFAGSTVTRTPEEIIPYSGALGFYMQADEVDADALVDWYDLCPTGDIKPYSAAGPCTGSFTPQPNIASGGQYRGWEYNLLTQTWTATRYVASGTYFVHQGNVVVGTGNATIPRLTVVASAVSPQDCTAKNFGNITWDHYEIDSPAFGGQWMFAETDLVTGSNFTAGDITGPTSGMFTAGDQVSMQTSSAGAVGSVVAADQCASPPPNGQVTTSSIQNPTIYYNPDSPAAFTSVITTSLWLDYSGG